MKEFKKGDLVRMVTIHNEPIPNKVGVVLGKCKDQHLQFSYYRVVWFDKEKESTTMWFMIEKIDEGR